MGRGRLSLRAGCVSAVPLQDESGAGCLYAEALRCGGTMKGRQVQRASSETVYLHHMQAHVSSSPPAHAHTLGGACYD